MYYKMVNGWTDILAGILILAAVACLGLLIAGVGKKFNNKVINYVGWGLIIVVVMGFIGAINWNY